MLYRFIAVLLITVTVGFSQAPKTASKAAAKP